MQINLKDNKTIHNELLSTGKRYFPRGRTTTPNISKVRHTGRRLELDRLHPL